jgi:hypothetical protein
MNENITVAVFYTKARTLDKYLRQEYLKLKPQPTRSFMYQFYVNAKSNDLILLVVKCLRNCCVQNSGRSVRETKYGKLLRGLGVKIKQFLGLKTPAFNFSHK